MTNDYAPLHAFRCLVCGKAGAKTGGRQGKNSWLCETRGEKCTKTERQIAAVAGRRPRNQNDVQNYTAQCVAAFISMNSLDFQKLRTNAHKLHNGYFFQAFVAIMSSMTEIDNKKYTLLLISFHQACCIAVFNISFATMTRQNAVITRSKQNITCCDFFGFFPGSKVAQSAENAHGATLFTHHLSLGNDSI